MSRLPPECGQQSSQRRRSQWLVQEGKSRIACGHDQVGIVIGGGNIFRGIKLQNSGIERAPADHIGLLATMMNGIALERTLISLGA